MNPRTGLLVGLAIAACLVIAFTPASHAQDGLQKLIEKQQAQNRQGPPPQVVGMVLTVLSMVMLILVAALASALSQQTEANETKDGESDAAAPAPRITPDVEARRAPEPTPPPAVEELQVGEGVSRVRCPRCAQVVVDFKGLRRDALSCPNCGDVLRPAP